MSQVIGQVWREVVGCRNWPVMRVPLFIALRRNGTTLTLLLTFTRLLGEPALIFADLCLGTFRGVAVGAFISACSRASRSFSCIAAFRSCRTCLRSSSMVQRSSTSDPDSESGSSPGWLLAAIVPIGRILACVTVWGVVPWILHFSHWWKADQALLVHNGVSFRRTTPEVVEHVGHRKINCTPWLSGSNWPWQLRRLVMWPPG